jgi:hypothetical protein
MTEPSGPAPDAPETGDGTGRHRRRFELISVLLLAFTAVATAWSGYQASLWKAEQSSSYTQAGSNRTKAAQSRTEADQYRIADLNVFQNYIDAVVDGNDDVADFYRTRFRDEFEPAFDAWWDLDPLDNPDAPATPLAMPEYRLDADARAAQLEQRADELFEQGEDAKTNADVYTMTTVLFALVLFFTAIAERFTYPGLRTGLLIMAGIGLLTGIVVALTQPITAG